MEQAIQQIAGFPGAQMKEFERADPGGIDRGLLQAKMWLRSGGAEAITTSSTMGPPGLRSMPPKTVASSKQAEEFLSLANWSVLKSPACPNAIRAQTHRNFGKLYLKMNLAN